MKLLFGIFGYIISIPARAKGMKFGKNSFIAPGYDFLFEQLKNIRVGDNCLIGKNSWIHTVGSGQIFIGDNSQIGRRATIAANKLVKIGANCLLSYDISLLDHNHGFEELSASPLKSNLTEGQDIIIEDDCFIGAHSFILKGVHLGKHCIVGANSVVTKSFPDFSIIAGNPAKIIRTITEN